MLDSIDLMAEREAAAALRLQRLTGAAAVFDRAGDGWSATRLNDGSAYRSTRRVASIRAHERIAAAFAGERITTVAPRMDIVTAADRVKRADKRQQLAERAKQAAALRGVALDRETAQAILTGRAQLSKWAKEIAVA